MPKNHISNPNIGIIEMIESENRKTSNQNRKIEIGIIEAEIRIEATKLTKRIVTTLGRLNIGKLLFAESTNLHEEISGI